MGRGMKPSEVAAEIAGKVPDCDLIEKVNDCTHTTSDLVLSCYTLHFQIEVVPAGFINVFLNKSFIEKQIGTIASKVFLFQLLPFALPESFVLYLRASNFL